MRLRWLTVVFVGVGLLTACAQAEPTPTTRPATPTPVPATPTPTPSPARTPILTRDDLMGSWRMDGLGYVIEFKEDGTYNLGFSEFGRFHLEGSLLTITTADDALFCPGTIGIYEIELTEDGKLQWTLREDTCAPRGGVAQNSVYSQISS